MAAFLQGAAMNIYEKLMMIQGRLKAPKSKSNDFSGFKYRSAEDILEAAKPILQDIGAALILSDSVKHIEGRFYVVATAKLVDITSGAEILAKAMARECDARPKFDVAQLTGAASSYARKYALNGLFCLDDTQDVDCLDNTGGQRAASTGHAAKTSKDNSAAEKVAAENKAAGGGSAGSGGKAAGGAHGIDAAGSGAGGRSGKAAGSADAEGSNNINTVQEQLLVKMTVRKGQQVAAIMERYKITELAALNENQYRAIMAELQRLPDIEQHSKK